MKALLMVAVLVFVASVGDFCWRGLDAYARAGKARSELADRVAASERLRGDQPLTSHARFDVLAQEHDTLREQIGRRRLRLLDNSLFNPPPHLSALLPRWPDLPVDRPTLLAWEGERDADAAVSRLLELLADAQVSRVSALSLPDGMTARPNERVPGLTSLAIDLELIDELPLVLEALERLAPGQGEPCLTVRSALLTRIEPEAWGSLPSTPQGPPVRLKARLEVLFGTVVVGAGR